MEDKPDIYLCVQRNDIQGLKTAIRENKNSFVYENGEPATNVACRFNYTEALKILLEAGFDPNATSNGTVNGLHQALLWGNPECAKLLLDSKANPGVVVHGKTMKEIAEQKSWLCYMDKEDGERRYKKCLELLSKLS